MAGIEEDDAFVIIDRGAFRNQIGRIVPVRLGPDGPVVGEARVVRETEEGLEISIVMMVKEGVVKFNAAYTPDT